VLTADSDMSHKGHYEGTGVAILLVLPYYKFCCTEGSILYRVDQKLDHFEKF